MDVLERATFEVKTFGHPSKESGLSMMLEITRLRQLLSEADKREREAREKAVEEAAAIADKEAAWRERLFKANKHTDNAAKSAQSRVIADAIRAMKTEASNVTNQ